MVCLCPKNIIDSESFAEYVAVDQKEIAKMPEGYDFTTVARIPLTGLTAYQAITEELEAKPGQTLLIPGGSGSFGEMAVPIAEAILYVFVLIKVIGYFLSFNNIFTNNITVAITQSIVSNMIL